MIEADDQARADRATPVTDRVFIYEHTSGFEAFDASVRQTAWGAIVAECGLTEQGQRTVGIAEKAALVPMEKLRTLFGFDPPQYGMHIVDAAEGILDGRVKAMLCLGGNLIRALPDSERLQVPWTRLELRVAVSTTLNRSHLYPGKAAITTPRALNAVGVADAPGRFRLMTMRFNDQFNTTIYGLSDRFRGIEGTRDVLLMNANEMQDAGLAHGEQVALVGDAADGVERRLAGLRIVRFDLPRGTIGS